MTPRGGKENPLATEMRRRKLLGRKASEVTRRRISEAKRRSWAEGRYDHLRTKSNP